MLIALVVDAISDPMVGRWSDSFRSRWGRRHPFLYLSILPVAISYYFLWNPPQLSQQGLFFYLLSVSITMRLALSAFSVPFTALVPELTDDYEERTKLINYSTSSLWFFGTLMAVAMYSIWLADTPGSPEGSGILNEQGYREAGAITAIILLLTMLFASVATHRLIPELHPPRDKSANLTEVLSELFESMRNRSFSAMALSGVFSATASGTSTALWAYIQPYFWGFNSEQISIMLTTQLLSALLAFALLPMISKGREKRDVLINMSWALIIIGAGPVFLRLLNVFPDNGSELLFPLMCLLGIIQVMLIVMISVVTGSMLSDIVDARQLETGHREEGSLLAVQSFITKVATGLGTLASGLILSLVAFPSDTQTQAVESSVISNLGWVYGPVLATFYLAAIIVVRRYDISRARHEETVVKLQSRRAS